MIDSTGTYRENTPLNSSTNTYTSPTSSLAGRTISVNWGLEFTEGRTWRGWLYTLGKLVNHLANNIFSCSFSWTITTTITTDEHRDLVTDEWFNSHNNLNDSSLESVHIIDSIFKSGFSEENLSTTPVVAQLSPKTPTSNSSSPFTFNTSHETLDNSSEASVMSLEVEFLIGEEICSIEPIDRDYAEQTPWASQVENHETAKVWLKKILETIGSDITFFSPPQRATGLLSEDIIPQGKAPKLSRELFGWKIISSLRAEIEKDGQSEEQETPVYTIDSDYDMGYRPSREEIEPGMAVRSYTLFPTEASDARLAFSDEQVELLNCATHKGYNGLLYLLNEDTKEDISRSCFLLPQERYQQFLHQLQENGHKIQYPCVSGVPNQGTRIVYQMLMPLNPIFESFILDRDQMNEIYFLMQLHSWRAQFAQCLTLAEKTGKPVHFKALASQLVNKNAFYKAIKEYEDQLVSSKVRITFQDYRRSSRT